MKSLNPAELWRAAEDLNDELRGAQLQDVFLGPRGPILSFWKQGIFTLYVDLSPLNPLIFLFEGKGHIAKQRAQKPAQLFLRSHGVGKLFDSAWVDPIKGRVLELNLRGELETCALEIRLFPHGQNLKVRSGGKEVTWFKPKELPPSAVDQGEYKIERRLADLAQELQVERRSAAKDHPVAKSAISQTQKKTTKLLKKLREERDRRGDLLWSESGQLLLVQQSLEDLPDNLQELIDRQHSLAWNIENCFAKAKDNKKKIANLNDRIATLENELKKLEKGEVASAFPERSAEPSSASRLMQKSQARGRKMDLGDGAEAIVGKSAQDNLNLLRRAQAWDLWLHLKDYPGAHAIVRRNKKRELTDNEVRSITSWLVQESLGKSKLGVGEVYAVVIAECRYVRPIKGDKLGRVTFQNEKNFQFKL